MHLEHSYHITMKNMFPTLLRQMAVSKLHFLPCWLKLQA